MTAYLWFHVDDGLARLEAEEVEHIRCLTEQATSAQCMDAAKRLMLLADLRHRVRDENSAYCAALDAEEAEADQ